MEEVIACLFAYWENKTQVYTLIMQRREKSSAVPDSPGIMASSLGSRYLPISFLFQYGVRPKLKHFPPSAILQQFIAILHHPTILQCLIYNYYMPI